VNYIDGKWGFATYRYCIECCMKLWPDEYIRGFRKLVMGVPYVVCAECGEFGLEPIDQDPQAREKSYCQPCWQQELSRREADALGGGYRSVSRPSNFLRCIKRLLCLGI
jgi:hypothetical protein